jgi:DNA-binding GntR family transcriptional regulator
MSPSTLREQAYRHIHGKIASGLLTGGSLVSELSLARELGISRTPVREAIRQLIMEGLVEQVPRHGTIVRIPNRRELAELYEVREALESYAVAEAARRIEAADLELLGCLYGRMRDLGRQLLTGGAAMLEGTALREFLAADMGFHLTLIRATGNRRIMQIVGAMGVLVRIFGHRRQSHTPGIVRRTCRFHARILRAVRRGDADAARRWMVRHLRASKRQSLESMDRAQEELTGIPLTLPEELLEELQRMEGRGVESPKMEKAVVEPSDCHRADPDPTAPSVAEE